MNAPVPIRRPATVFLATAVVLALLVGTAVDHVVVTDFPDVTPVRLHGKWVTTASELDYSGCFRKTVSLSSAPQSAWLMISAQDAFEVIVNGNTVDHLFLWRPTRQFDYGLSEPGQRLIKSLPMLSLNYPREYQWESYRSYEVPVYIDLTPYLLSGDNSICVALEARTAPAKFNLYGEIVQATGERLPIVSDRTWKTQATPQYSGSLEWSLPHYDDQFWGTAVETSAPPGEFIRQFDPAIFQREFQGRWLRSSLPIAQNAVWFETDWPLASRPRDAWLRLVGNRSYDLFVNGQHVGSTDPGTATLDAGNWIIGMESATDITTSAEILEDEGGTLEKNNRFLPPPHTDQAVAPPTSNGDQVRRFHEHPFGAPGATARKPERGTAQAPPLAVFAPQERAPDALRRDRRSGEFNAYSIAPLLHAGANHLSVRLLPAEVTPTLDWSPQIAVDAGATLQNGAHSYLASGAGWQVILRNARGEVTRSAAALPGSAARQSGSKLPALQYRGFFYGQDEALVRWMGYEIGSLLLILGGALGVLRWHRTARSAWFSPAPLAPEEALAARLFLAQATEIVLLPATILGAAFLVQAAWGERQEILWFHTGATWALILGTALAVMLISVYRLFVRRGTGPSDASATLGASFLNRLPDSVAWKGLVVGLLTLFFFIAAHGLDFQPIEDDEYASIEASVAIAEHGVPRYTDEVWYSRSPFYHYLDGSIIFLFGENLWAMRLPSAVFGVLTAWLIYHCGRRLLGSPWVGLGALCLFIIHPFAITSSHIARFYQQQQFFALLTIYCFCRGFVVEQSMRFRYATLLSLLCTVLCQELSVVLGLQLGIGYLIFAQRKPWRDEIRLLVAAGCMLTVITTDILVFLTRCQTHMEGVSPNVEPTLHPQFASPLNFFSIFVAYSRLHLALSFLFALGLPFALKSRHRPLFALYFVTLTGALFVNLLVTGANFRYQYWLLPTWLLLSVWGIKAFVAFLDGAISQPGFSGGDRQAWIKPAAGAVFFVAALLSFSPWHILGTYDTKILGDSTGAFQFVRSNLRPGDMVASTEPHPHGALLEAGRSDYDLSFPRLYDFVYLKHGKLVDRNAGAESVGSIDELQGMLTRHDRVWIVVNRVKFRSRGQDIGWDYPDARPELFLRRNCRIAYQSYLWTVFLWDVHNGDYFDYRAHMSE